MSGTRGEPTQVCFEEVFRRHGLPQAIRTDLDLEGGILPAVTPLIRRLTTTRTRGLHTPLVGTPVLADGPFPSTRVSTMFPV